MKNDDKKNKPETKATSSLQARRLMTETLLAVAMLDEDKGLERKMKRRKNAEANNAEPDEEADAPGQTAEQAPEPEAVQQVAPATSEQGAPAPFSRTSNTTIFTDEAVDAARARLRAKLKGRLNSRFDPEMLQDGITQAGWHIENGARKFADFARSMIADMGEDVTPFLKSWYLGAKFDPRAAHLDGTSTAAEVEAFDVDALDCCRPARPGRDRTLERRPCF